MVIVTLTMLLLGARSEDVLAAMAGAHAPVREVRAVRDKFTGAPRGFCFLHLHSIYDAARVMQLLQARRPACARLLQAGPGPAGALLGMLFNLNACCGACCQQLAVHLAPPVTQPPGAPWQRETDSEALSPVQRLARRARAWRARPARCGCATRASALRPRAPPPMRWRRARQPPRTWLLRACRSTTSLFVAREAGLLPQPVTR